MRALGSTQMASWVESLEGSPKPVQILLQSVIPADQSTCFLKAPHPTFSSYLSIQGSDSTSYRNYPLFRVGLRLRPSIDQCLSNHSQYRSIGLGCHSKETCGTNSTPQLALSLAQIKGLAGRLLISLYDSMGLPLLNERNWKLPSAKQQYLF